MRAMICRECSIVPLALLDLVREALTFLLRFFDQHR
jgi:hypothetical protein